MDKEAIPRRGAAVLALAVALALAVLAVAAVVASPKAASAAPPDPADDAFTERGLCDFPVRFEVSGKAKFIELPDGRAIAISPGLRVTLTNLEERTNSVSYVITGAFHIRELADGRLLVVATGRNLLFDPSFGMFLTIGRFTFKVNEDGSTTRPKGEGRMIDVCRRLA
jgi:hypothetical protein